MKKERKPEYPEETRDNELQKMPQTKAPKFKPQPRLEPALWHWRQAGKAAVLTITPLTSWGILVATYRLVGLVVKASALRAEDPGFKSRLRRDFFGVESYQ